MAEPYAICVGTVGSGIFNSQDGGTSWKHSVLEMPLPPWSPWIQIRSISVSPHDANHLVAGSDVGVHLSEDRGASWKFVHSPADRMQVWSTAWHPGNPDTLLVGVAPFDSGKALFRSTDRGRTWRTLPIAVTARSRFGASHVTRIVFDPRDERTILASVEVDGLFRSRDGGDSWERLPPFGETTNNSDIHCVGISREGTIFATTPDGFWTSLDDGQSFSLHKFPPFPDREERAIADGITGYSRGFVFKEDEPDTILVGIGDYTPGKHGGIQRSRDGGTSWSAAALPERPNSHIYAIATHPADPELMVAATMFGYVYESRDGGNSWRKLPREFGEIRALAWAPV